MKRRTFLTQIAAALPAVALAEPFIFGLRGNVPLTLHTSVWWAAASNLTLAMLAALAIFGFHASRAGQPLFGDTRIG